MRLETFHGIGRLRIDGPLPHAIADAAIGRPISSVIDHPWLAGTRWPIVRIEEGKGALCWITFETGMVGWRPHELT